MIDMIHVSLAITSRPTKFAKKVSDILSDATKAFSPSDRSVLLSVPDHQDTRALQ